MDFMDSMYLKCIIIVAISVLEFKIFKVIKNRIISIRNTDGSKKY